ncbi:MAG: WecB/TagA/CpsF family glycosyltransferase [Treponema sp.]|nr:WecB/TagA/CpsF family glycosyltransferase [Treponema sp.]
MDTTHEINKARVKLLNVPIDIVSPEQLGPLVFELLAAKEPQDIVLLSLWDLLRFRRNAEYRAYVQHAAMVIPISKSLISGARFLSGKKPVRYMPFDFVINLLTILESRNYSVYLLGGKRRVLLKAEKNISQTFPHLHIVGRCIGAFKRTDEPDITEAIRKSAPSLLLTGKGVRGGELWISRNKTKIGSGLRLWCSDLFEVFAEKKKRPSRGAFEAGLEWIGYCFQKPYKFCRVFLYIYYLILLLVYKIFSL